MIHHLLQLTLAQTPAAPVADALSSLWPYLVAGASLLVAVATLIGRRDKGRDDLRKTVDEAQPKAACVACRKEVDAMLASLRDALKDGLHERARTETVQRMGFGLETAQKSIAVIEAQLAALTESNHRIEAQLERLLEHKIG
jgi:hypothetical protein